ncbi:MAG: restriction endonuclease subunit S, partial [Mariprofundaceae bacterium]
KRQKNVNGDLSTELSNQQALLRKLRQQILQEAIEGKLTADWRAENPDVEPASELLARIKAEKEQLIKDKKIKNQKALPPITDEEKLFEIPEGWEWTRVGDITSVVTSGSRNWKSYYSESGSSFIRSQDIKFDRLQYANRAFVNVRKNEEGARTFVKKGDWLITITGGNVGKCAHLDDEPGDAYVSQHVGLMRPVLEGIGQFGHVWLTAEHGGRGLLSDFIYGDKPGLNLPQLRGLLFPLPPINEQNSIVAKIERLFAICDQLKVQITSNQTHAEQMMQAVLKEAFQYEKNTRVRVLPL